MLHLPPEVLDRVLAHTTFASKIALACKELRKAHNRRIRQLITNAASVTIHNWTMKRNGAYAFTIASNALRFRHSLLVEHTNYGICCTKRLQKCRFSSIECEHAWTLVPSTELVGKAYTTNGEEQHYIDGIAKFIAASYAV